MKSTIKAILVMIIFGGISAGCGGFSMGESADGSGIVTTEKISTEDYDVIRVEGFMNVHLEDGKEGEIMVSTDDNLHEYLDIEVDGDVLILKMKSGISLLTNEGVNITVPVKSISEISLSGSGDIDSKDVIVSEELSTSISGSGDIDIDVKAKKVSVEISGSGDVELTGAAINLDVSINGSGTFKGYGLVSQFADVKSSGSGDAKVFVIKSLIARGSGSGDIVYKGEPSKSDVNSSGSGYVIAY